MNNGEWRVSDTQTPPLQSHSALPVENSKKIDDSHNSINRNSNPAIIPLQSTFQSRGDLDSNPGIVPPPAPFYINQQEYSSLQQTENPPVPELTTTIQPTGSVMYQLPVASQAIPIAPGVIDPNMNHNRQLPFENMCIRQPSPGNVDAIGLDMNATTSNHVPPHVNLQPYVFNQYSQNTSGYLVQNSPSNQYISTPSPNMMAVYSQQQPPTSYYGQYQQYSIQTSGINHNMMSISEGVSLPRGDHMITVYQQAYPTNDYQPHYQTAQGYNLGNNYSQHGNFSSSVTPIGGTALPNKDQNHIGTQSFLVLNSQSSGNGSLSYENPYNFTISSSSSEPIGMHNIQDPHKMDAQLTPKLFHLNSNVKSGMKWNSGEMQDTKRRTKSGCLTCRRRRVKCDELRPQCRNCYKAERVCLGYDTVFTPERLERIKELIKSRIKFQRKRNTKQDTHDNIDTNLCASEEIQSHAQKLLEDNASFSSLPPLRKINLDNDEKQTVNNTTDEANAPEQSSRQNILEPAVPGKSEQPGSSYVGSENKVVSSNSSRKETVEKSNDDDDEHERNDIKLENNSNDEEFAETTTGENRVIEVSSWKEVAELFRDHLGESIDELFELTSLYRGSGHVVNHFNMKGPFLANVASKVEVMRQMLLIVYPNIACSKLDITELTALEKLHATDEYSIMRALIEAFVPDSIDRPGDIANASVNARYPQARYTRRPEHPRRMATNFSRIENLAKILYINHKNRDAFFSDQQKVNHDSDDYKAKDLVNRMCQLMENMVDVDDTTLTEKIWEVVDIALELCNYHLTELEIKELSKGTIAVNKMADMAKKGSARGVLALLAFSASSCVPARDVLRNIKVPSGLSASILEIALMPKNRTI